MSNVIDRTLALRLFSCCDNGNDILSTLDMIADGFTDGDLAVTEPTTTTTVPTMEEIEF
jgi:hypothetical protein